MRHGVCRLATLVSIAALVPALAAASSARLRGLNAPGDYVRGEDTGMFTYVSGVNSLGNLVMVEAGSFRGPGSLGDRAVGAVLPGLFDGKCGVWALQLRQSAPAMGQSWADAGLNPGDGARDGNAAGEAFDIIWGQKLGDGHFALRLNRSFQSSDAGGIEVEGNGANSRNVMGFGGGYDWDLNASTHVQLGALLQERRFDSGPSGFKNDGTRSYLIAARAFHKAAGDLTVIPVFKLFSLDRGYQSNLTSAATTHKRSGWQAGAAGNWNVGTDDLLVFGAQIAQNRDDHGNDTRTTETLAPNVFLALETKVNPWLTFRAGAQNAMIYSVRSETASSDVTTRGHYFTFNLGTTVKLGNLTFDAVLDPGFLQNPFAQLMGAQDAWYDGGNVAFPEVSATYSW